MKENTVSPLNRYHPPMNHCKDKIEILKKHIFKMFLVLESEILVISINKLENL